MVKSKAPKAYDPCKGRPYNRYNIYYILERERFLQSFPGYKTEQSRNEGEGEDDLRRRGILTGYEELQRDLPPLAPRYEKLELSHDWYMPGKRKVVKRDHKKSHGVASFREIAKFVADGWKTIDDETLKYCTEVARVLKRRHEELKEMGGLKCFAEKHLARLPKAAPKPKAASQQKTVPPKAAWAKRFTENCLARQASAPPLLTASLTEASNPRPAATAPMPTMEDFVWDAPPFPKAASDPKPAAAAPMPTMEDFVWDAPPLVDLVQSQSSLATSPDSYTTSQRALLSSIANNCFGGSRACEDPIGGGDIARAEGDRALRRSCSVASVASIASLSDSMHSSLSDSMHSAVDIPDLDIMALWYTEI